MSNEGIIYRVAGPVVTATGISPRMYDVVYVGNEKLMGEVIQEMIELQEEEYEERKAIERQMENHI